MPLSTEEILRHEANEIHHTNLKEEHTGTNLCVALNQLNSAALCLSGGGIRSAAFALGVIQALAVSRPARVQEARNSPPPDPVQSLLSQFHYLSTVSGGGYIGSWLSAWRLSEPFPKIWASLTGRPGGADVEPPQLGWLRSYTNYLTPRIGLASADTWAATALALRNLILNWVVILPMVLAIILLLKIMGLASNWTIVWGITPEWTPHWSFGLDGWTIYIKIASEIGSFIAGMFSLIVALAWMVGNQPSSRPPGDQGPTQAQFLQGAMFWSILSAVFLVHFLASDLTGLSLLRCQQDHAHKIGFVSMCEVGMYEKSELNVPKYYYTSYMSAGAAIGLFIYGAGWITAGRSIRNCFDLLAWATSGAVYGSLVGLGLFFYLMISDEGIGPIPEPFQHLVLGVPWVLMSQLIACTLFVGISSYKPGSDADREWFGRASGWLLAAAIVWLILTFLVYFGSNAVPTPDFLRRLKDALPAVVGLSGSYHGNFQQK